MLSFVPAGAFEPLPADVAGVTGGPACACDCSGGTDEGSLRDNGAEPLPTVESSGGTDGGTLRDNGAAPFPTIDYGGGIVPPPPLRRCTMTMADLGWKKRWVLPRLARIAGRSLDVCPLLQGGSPSPLAVHAGEKKRNLDKMAIIVI